MSCHRSFQNSIGFDKSGLRIDLIFTHEQHKVNVNYPPPIVSCLRTHNMAGAFNSPERVMQRARQSRTFRCIYGHPKSRNIFRSVIVSITNPAAMSTRKLLTTPIRFTANGMNMVAIVASLASISRVDKYKMYAMLNRFIYQELSQLEKRPTITQSPLFFTAGKLVGTFSNSGQIFQSNSLVAQSRSSYQPVTDGVVYQFLKASLLPRQLFQQFSTSASSTSGASRGFLLDVRSQFGVMISNFGDFFTAKFIPFGCNNNIDST